MEKGEKLDTKFLYTNCYKFRRYCDVTFSMHASGTKKSN